MPAATMLVLKLPSLVAGQDLADQMLDLFGRPFDQETVVVDARGTASGSPSFAGQLVLRTLADGRAERLVLVGAPRRFAQQVSDAANRQGVQERLHVTAQMPTPVVANY